MYLVISLPRADRRASTGNTGLYIKDQDSHFSGFLEVDGGVENTYFIPVVNSYGQEPGPLPSCPRKRSPGVYLRSKRTPHNNDPFQRFPSPPTQTSCDLQLLDHRCKCGGVLFLLVSPLLTAFHGAEAP